MGEKESSIIYAKKLITLRGLNRNCVGPEAANEC
jgi:hypothetical protein